MSLAHEIMAIHWEWIEGPYKGSTFWGCHDVEKDGRVRDWPKIGLRPIGAAKVCVTDGEGLDLLPVIEST